MGMSWACHGHGAFGVLEATIAEAASEAAMIATKLGKTWGLSASDTAESARTDSCENYMAHVFSHDFPIFPHLPARKCAYEAAEAAQATVTQALNSEQTQCEVCLALFGIQATAAGEAARSTARHSEGFRRRNQNRQRVGTVS